jgi:SAM-dependent methyltransferase
MLAGITREAFAIVDFRPGQRVLDIGCGTGATTLEIAHRVAPGGSVIGVDISEVMLEPACAEAAAHPDLAVNFEAADAETHAFPPESFDIAFSRFGVMFFADPARAFTNIRRAVAPGGRLAFLCWREPRRNSWTSLTIEVARHHLELPPAPGPEDPGPFSFREPERVQRILNQAGWSDIAVDPVEAEADMGGTLDEAVENLLHVGAIGSQIQAAPGPVRETITRELRELVDGHVTDRGVMMQALCWMVTAKA